jgi:uroporphyrinogen decarboxylase
MPMPTSESTRGAAEDLGAAPLLLRALRGEPVERPPVWFMRQAGRSLPEYREVRRKASLMEITHIPELTAEVTIQPVRRHGVDAAILFSDIVTPLEAIGVGVEIRPGVGPVIEQPIRSAADLARLRDFEPDVDAPWLAEAVRTICGEIREPLIGFAGAPFTLASYLVEGGPSKNMGRTKAMMRSEPVLWTALLERLADIAAASLAAQVAAGASAVQVFDSWVGSLSVRDYEAYVLPSVARLFERTAQLGVPRIYFGLGTGHLLESIGTVAPDAIGVDWRVPLAQARARLPERIGLQGNLDPTACLAGPAELERELDIVLGEAPTTRYVFNLGHGVLPETDPGVLTHLAQLVRGRESEVRR